MSDEGADRKHWSVMDPERYKQWALKAAAEVQAKGNTPVEAATVILLRDAPDGPETLMLRRDSKLSFVGGMWVFPGGRVDSEDRAGLEADDVLGAARRAAVRESAEEAGLAIPIDDLATFSHWTPPAISPKRFLTWFFVAPAPAGAVEIDDGEIRDHAWLTPRAALERRDARKIELAPPTCITLHRLARYRDVAHAMQDSHERDPEFFATRIAALEDATVALYDGDAGYEDSDATREGPRHRLTMTKTGWRYECPDAD